MHLHLLGNYLLSSQVRRISLLTVQEDWIPMIEKKIKNTAQPLLKNLSCFISFFSTIVADVATLGGVNASGSSGC